MKVTESEQLLLKHLQGTLSPYERGILMRVIEESEEEEDPNNAELPPQKILAWEEIWQRTNLEIPNFDTNNDSDKEDNDILSFEEIV